MAILKVMPDRTKEENERIKNDEDPLKIFKKKVIDVSSSRINSTRKY